MGCPFVLFLGIELKSRQGEPGTSSVTRVLGTTEHGKKKKVPLINALELE